ncbi:MAG: Holliday junction resolvase RuvX [Bacilli bacterium]|nr:Holliday junction resolvase RuvX [Bacilli bacterium]
MVYLGLDLGSKTLGVSVSDRTGIIASSLEVLRYNDYEELLNKLDKIVEDKRVDVFVLGNPLNLNGSVSVRSEMSFEFKSILENRYNKEVVMQDERLSTVEANRMLISNDTRRKNRKKVVDKIAATIILQSYLDRRNNER